MKIALVSQYARGDRPESGLAYYTQRLVQERIEAGDSVLVLADRLGDKTIAVQRDPAFVRRLWDRSFASAWQIVRAVLREQPDLVWIQHSLFFFGNGPGAVAAPLALLLLLRIIGKRTLLEVHDVRDLGEVTPELVSRHGSPLPAAVVRFALRSLFMLMSRFATLTIVHSEELRKRLVSQYSAPRDRLVAIPLLVPEPGVLSQDDAKHRVAPGDERKILLFFGYATEYKGLDLLADALGAVSAEFARKVNVIIIAGKNPHLQDDPSYCREYETLRARFIAGGARWLGFLEEAELDIYMSAADGFIFPYKEKFGSSWPFARASRYGKPLLASEVLAPEGMGHGLTFPASRDGIKRALMWFADAPSDIAAAAASGLPENMRDSGYAAALARACGCVRRA